MKSFSVTDVGLKRNVNQDYVFRTENEIGKLPNLFIVADGMGGHKAGDYASRCCVETVVHYIENAHEETYISVLNGAIQHANAVLIQKATEDSNYEGMGTTFVAATIRDQRMIVANVGDSRLYVINDEIRQITKDHSLVELMVQNGELRREDVRFHPNKNVITRAIGAGAVVNADFFELDLNCGDVVLLCSDGLSNMLDDDKMFEIVTNNSHDLKKAASMLVDQANENGGKDNIAVIMIEL